MAFKMVAFSFSGIVAVFNGADNAWDLIRNLYQIPNIWQDYLDGKISRFTAKTEEYKLWKQKGVKLDKLMIDLRKNMKIMEGAKNVFTELNNKKIATAIISDSPNLVVEDVARQLGAKYFTCNRILFDKDGRAYDTVPSHPSGEQRAAKLLALKDFAGREKIRLTDIAFVGNQMEDIEIFKFVGRSIAFNARDPETKKSADAILNTNTLDDVLQYMK